MAMVIIPSAVLVGAITCVLTIFIVCTKSDSKGYDGTPMPDDFRDVHVYQNPYDTDTSCTGASKNSHGNASDGTLISNDFDIRFYGSEHEYDGTIHSHQNAIGETRALRDLGNDHAPQHGFRGYECIGYDESGNGIIPSSNDFGNDEHGHGKYDSETFHQNTNDHVHQHEYERKNFHQSANEIIPSPNDFGNDEHGHGKYDRDTSHQNTDAQTHVERLREFIRNDYLQIADEIIPSSNDFGDDHVHEDGRDEHDGNASHQSTDIHTHEEHGRDEYIRNSVPQSECDSHSTSSDFEDLEGYEDGYENRNTSEASIPRVGNIHVEQHECNNRDVDSHIYLKPIERIPVSNDAEDARFYRNHDSDSDLDVHHGCPISSDSENLDRRHNSDRNVKMYQKENNQISLSKDFEGKDAHQHRHNGIDVDIHVRPDTCDGNPISRDLENVRAHQHGRGKHDTISSGQKRTLTSHDSEDAHAHENGRDEYAADVFDQMPSNSRSNSSDSEHLSV